MRLKISQFAAVGCLLLLGCAVIFLLTIPEKQDERETSDSVYVYNACCKIAAESYMEYMRTGESSAYDAMTADIRTMIHLADTMSASSPIFSCNSILRGAYRCLTEYTDVSKQCLSQLGDALSAYGYEMDCAKYAAGLLMFQKAVYQEVQKLQDETLSWDRAEHLS